MKKLSHLLHFTLLILSTLLVCATSLPAAAQDGTGEETCPTDITFELEYENSGVMVLVARPIGGFGTDKGICMERVTACAAGACPAGDSCLGLQDESGVCPRDDSQEEIKLKECDTMRVTHVEMYNHPGGWGTYMVKLRWEAYPGATGYEVRVTLADRWAPAIFTTTTNALLLHAGPFYEGEVVVVVIALVDGKEMCYTVNRFDLTQEGLIAWRPPAADPGPYPIGTGVVHEPACAEPVQKPCQGAADCVCGRCVLGICR